MMNTLPMVVAVLTWALGAGHAAVLVQTADADTYVRDGFAADQNFGSETVLKAKARTAEYHRRTLIRFDLSGAAISFDEAVFSITQTATHANQQIRVFGLADGLDGWDENTLTFNSATSLGLLDESAATDLGTIDFSFGNNGERLSLSNLALTSFLQDGIGGDGLVTFLITSTQTSNFENAVFASRESSLLGPELSFTSADEVPVPAAAFLFAPWVLLIARHRMFSYG